MIKIEKGMGFYLIKSDIYCDLLTCIDCAKINYIFILKLYFYSEPLSLYVYTFDILNLV